MGVGHKQPNQWDFVLLRDAVDRAKVLNVTTADYVATNARMRAAEARMRKLDQDRAHVSARHAKRPRHEHAHTAC